MFSKEIGYAFKYFYKSFEKTLADRHVKIENMYIQAWKKCHINWCSQFSYLSATVSK